MNTRTKFLGNLMIEEVKILRLHFFRDQCDTERKTLL